MEIIDLFVPYKIATELKKIGFNEPCLGYYFDSANGRHFNFEVTPNQTEFKVIAPLYQQVIDWLLKEHNIIIELQLDRTSTIKWAYRIYEYKNVCHFSDRTNIVYWSLYREKNEALNNAIIEALNIIDKINTFKNGK